MYQKLIQKNSWACLSSVNSIDTLFSKVMKSNLRKNVGALPSQLNTINLGGINRLTPLPKSPQLHQLHKAPTTTTSPRAHLDHLTIDLCKDAKPTKTQGIPIAVLKYLGLCWRFSSYLLILLNGLTAKIISHKSQSISQTA